MNGKIGQKTVLGIVTVSLWVLCTACGGDSPTTPNIAQNSAQSAAGTANAETEKSETTLSNARMTLPPVPVSRYQGKRNPFSPLITLKKEQELIVPSARPVRRDPQTTLEKIALGQLTLTAIFKGSKGRKAIVEEEGGKGHIVEKGTFIGTRGGRVQAITRDRVVIIEKTANSNGKVTTHKRELKLASQSNDPS